MSVASIMFPGIASALHLHHDDGEGAEARLRAAVQAEEADRADRLSEARARLAEMRELEALLEAANTQGPCGSSCATCPVSCGPEAPEFDPAEMAAYLAGELADEEDPR